MLSAGWKTRVLGSNPVPTQMFVDDADLDRSVVSGCLWHLWCSWFPLYKEKLKFRTRTKYVILFQFVFLLCKILTQTKQLYWERPMLLTNTHVRYLCTCIHLYTLNCIKTATVFKSCLLRNILNKISRVRNWITGIKILKCSRGALNPRVPEFDIITAQ